MADDLEAFLRQAAQRRAARKAAAPQAPQPARAVPPARSPEPLASRSLTRQDADIVEAVVVPVAHERLESHVDTTQFQRRAEHLGETVGLADEQLESHLQAKFEHRLGALDDAPGMPGEVQRPPSAAELLAREILQMLTSPHSVRKAIVLNEILSPPAHRW
jgi:hypothetical protein